MRKNNIFNIFAAILVLFATFPSKAAEPSIAGASGSCGDIQNTFGPYDYRKYVGTEASKHSINDPLFLVESTHFTSDIENLIRGNSGSLGNELDYTLRAFPNHHRALLAMIRLTEKLKTEQPKGARYTAGCWFERAIKFQADDAIVRMIYAKYLGDRNRREQAIAQLEVASQLADDNPFSHYNIGMIYADLKVFDRALVQAHRALELGMMRTELKKRLIEVDRWREPVEVEVEGDAELAQPEGIPAKQAEQ